VAVSMMKRNRLDRAKRLKDRRVIPRGSRICKVCNRAGFHDRDCVNRPVWLGENRFGAVKYHSQFSDLEASE